jgi:hypothetical protein
VATCASRTASKFSAPKHDLEALVFAADKNIGGVAWQLEIRSLAVTWHENQIMIIRQSG